MTTPRRNPRGPRSAPVTAARLRPPPAPPPLSAAEMQSLVLYRDALVLILNKPAGIAVHAGPGGGPNLEACFDGLRFGLPKLPALAHRLDRDTSGCLVLGRHHKALARLGRLFAEGRVEKTYWAIVHGAPPQDEGVIELALAKRNDRSGWRMVVDPAGQTAVTQYRVRGRSGDVTWLELRPHTGRTHQIRVHCAALGCPLLGDPVYGTSAAGLTPMHLHARALLLPLYPTKPPLQITAPVPAHLLAALAACGYVDEAFTVPPAA